MKIIILISLVIFTLPVLADGQFVGEERPINSSHELKTWCKNRTSEYFLAKGTTPYNWTASWWTEGEFLYVKGTWKIGTKEYVFKCSARRKTAEKYATWKLIEE